MNKSNNELYESIMNAISKEVKSILNETFEEKTPSASRRRRPFASMNEGRTRHTRPFSEHMNRYADRKCQADAIEEGWLKNTAVAGAAALSMLGGPRANAQNVQAEEPNVRIEQTDRQGVADFVELDYSTDVARVFNSLVELYKKQNEGALTKTVVNGKGFGAYDHEQFKDGDQIVRYAVGTRKYEIIIPSSVNANDLKEVRAYASACSRNDVASFKNGSELVKADAKAYNASRTGNSNNTYYVK